MTATQSIQPRARRHPERGAARASVALRRQPTSLLRIDDRARGRELRAAAAPPWSTPAGTVADPAARRADHRRVHLSRVCKALGVRKASLDSFAPEFRQGMAARAAVLGDVGESSPEHWEKPLGTPDVHVALAALSPDAARLEAGRREGPPRPPGARLASR